MHLKDTESCTIYAEKLSLLFINMIFMSLVIGSEEDGLVSVPAEGSVSSGISSVVNMVGAGVGGSSRGTIGGGAAGSLNILELCHLGLSGEAGAPHDGDASEVCKVGSLGLSLAVVS